MEHLSKSRSRRGRAPDGDGHSHVLINQNMDKLNKIAAPAADKIRQLQKMVQDIKKNDGSIVNRLKKFQNEQAAFIRKTGKNTWDRLKSKQPPKVPNRDYNQDDDLDGDQWSGSEFDSDAYEDPQQHRDDSYEPPPSECSKRAFVSAAPTYFPKGEYIDSQHSGHRRQAPPPRKPSLPSQEDYIKPEDEDDNYIDPSEDPVSDARGAKAKGRRPPVPSEAAERPHSPDVYEVPDLEENESHALQSRIHSKAPPTIPEPSNEEEYEICDTDERHMETNCPPRDKCSKQDKPALPSPKAPIPRPRERKKPNIPQKPKLVKRDMENEATPLTRNVQPRHAASPPRSITDGRAGSSPQSVSHTFLVHRKNKPPPQRRTTTEEKEAGVYQKTWYAGACDRKTAEDALMHVNKDGSFLVRNSSGQDAQQPYTLVVLYKNRVYNIPIRFIESSNQYALGREKKGEERFSTINSIIENHQKKALVLIDSQNNTKDCTKLCHAVTP